MRMHVRTATLGSSASLWLTGPEKARARSRQNEASLAAIQFQIEGRTMRAVGMKSRPCMRMLVIAFPFRRMKTRSLTQ